MIKLICAIGIAVSWLIVVTLITITSHDTLYHCDPEKNTKCQKTNCHINGGDLPAHNSQKVQEEEIMQERVKQIVVDYFNNRAGKTDHVYITTDDVFVVWFCKTLQNWKALLSTTVPDGMYYEVTHNGDRGETYLDAYKKWENMCYIDVVRNEEQEGDEQA